MKKTSVLLVLSMIFLVSLGFVVANGVGNPDNECQTNGFDYGIAKYQCGFSDVDELGSEGENYDISVEWGYDYEQECASAEWTSMPEVGGVLLKAGNDPTVVLSGGLSGTVEKEVHAISHITFCGNYPPIVPEFGTIIAMFTALSALGIFFIVRRSN